MIICKDCGKSVAPEECRNLKVNDPKETFGFRLDQLCEECFQKRLKETAEKPIGPEEENKPIGKSDIFRIIYKAMESKDRQVSIYIHGDVMSVNVTPYEVEEHAWIAKACDWFVCPECGGDSHIPTRYCSRCGEQLAIPARITEEPDGDTEC